ncbi:FAD/NAD(P)-binding protein [Nocardiopsis mangrovi]|uniref:FAD/NAD(P)-binding protein n=1 Tax=Nocardiopsis mangrovi TaxID=1179818 RepID=A0ABV9DZL1_9ACTN
MTLHPQPPSAPRPLDPVIAIIGAGPRGTSLLERLIANAPHILPGARADVHLVDPYPPGGGRIWRHRQSPLLWMNTTAADCTMFTDSTVACEGPIVPGPGLDTWANDAAAGRLDLPPGFRPHPASLAEAARVHPGWFATRRLQSDYLAWVYRHVAAQAPPGFGVHTHATAATDVRDLPGGRQRVLLADGSAIDADTVLFAQGNIAVRPDPAEERLAAHAAAHGLAYVPTASTADIGLDAIRPGEPVIVRGLGLAFIDAMVLLTSGRGGRFERGPDGGLRYLPSGREPVIHAGSRRGVPYHSKIHYSLPGERPALPRHFHAGAVAALGDRPLDIADDLRPLILRELADATYRELAASHPERLAMAPERFLAELDAVDWAGPGIKALIAEAVPDDADRFDPDRLDRPLAGLRFADADALQAWLHAYIDADLRRRRDQRYSGDLAVFHGLLSVFGVLAELLAAGRIAPGSEERDVPEFLGFFSYLASGPPGPRLEELLALARAGVVRFLGADTEVVAHDDGFRAASPSAPGEVRARALVDARLPRRSLARTADPLLARLAGRGEITERVRTDPATGTAHRTGLIDADPADQRLRRADGSVHPARFGAGIMVAGGVGSGGFSRPRTNAGFFRQNDAIARAALRQAVGG